MLGIKEERDIGNFDDTNVPMTLNCSHSWWSRCGREQGSALQPSEEIEMRSDAITRRGEKELLCQQVLRFWSNVSSNLVASLHCSDNQSRISQVVRPDVGKSLKLLTSIKSANEPVGCSVNRVGKVCICDPSVTFCITKS